MYAGKLTAVMGVLVLAGSLMAAGDKKTDKPLVIDKPDEVETHVAIALNAYRAEKPADAIAELQAAINLIQAQLSKTLAGQLPDAPQGWSAGEVESDSMSVGAGGQGHAFSTAKRTYTRKADKAEVTVEITDSTIIIGAHKQMAQAFQNPQMIEMMNRDPDTQIKVLKIPGWVAWAQTSKGGSASGTLIAVSEHHAVNVQSNSAEMAILDQFAKLVDFQAIAKLRTSESTAPAKGAPDKKSR